MKLHNIEAPKKALKNRKRVGRGPGSGSGKTSGSGENGQKSRSGAKIRPVFEGGQTPLFRRIPKRGFTNARFRKEFAIINLTELDKFEDGAVVTLELLKEMGLIKKELSGLKVLGFGDITKKITIKTNRISKSAQEKIEKIGGKVEVI